MKHLGIYIFGKAMFKKLWLILNKADDYVMSQRYEDLISTIFMILVGILICITIWRAILWWQKEEQ